MSRVDWIQMERLHAIKEAEEFLNRFGRLWPTLDYDDLPALVKYAIGSLVIVSLADPLRAQVRMPAVAAAAKLTLFAIRKQVRERTWLYMNLTRLIDDPTSRAKAKLTWAEVIAL